MKPSRRSITRALSALVACSLLAACNAPAALAHASFEGSSPTPGTRVGSAPGQVMLRFNEALNRQLSTAAVYNAQTERRVAAGASVSQALEIVLTPAQPLPRGSYRVEWHSVSADDGHELEGSFSFGVQAPALVGVASAQTNPFSGLGWLRTLLRTALYPALFLFAGALMLRTVLGAGARGLWLLPEPVRARLDPGEAASVERRERSLVLDAGLVAIALAAAGALLDTRLAAGSLSPKAIHAFLLSNATGLARVWLVVLLALAWTGARAAPRKAGVVAAAALGALALAGHADSATPRGLAVVVDWVHLLAGAVWLGGIATIAWVWAPRLRRSGAELRRAVMTSLLPRFGRVALPAFIVVVITGSLNAYIELRHPSVLWSSSYGRALLVKAGLVGVIALISYTHVFRLRPRLLAANPHPDAALECRHWRLVGNEPLVGIALAAAVALLVSVPLPRDAAARQALAAAPLAACNPCVLPLPSRDQLAVATDAGSDVVAAWLRRRAGTVDAEIRVLAIDGAPASVPYEIVNATAVAVSCGPGCRRFSIPDAPGEIDVVLHAPNGQFRATLPTRWQPDGSGAARALLERAQAVMRRLSSVHETESVNSVPGLYALSDFRLQAPDRLATSNYVVRPPERPRLEGQSVEIGARDWFRSAHARWQLAPPAGTLPFSTPTWFTWTSYAESVRSISIARSGGSQLATIALMDPGTPAWWTLRVDVRSGRVLYARLITPGHFATDRFSEFNRAAPIATPSGRRP